MSDYMIREYENRDSEDMIRVWLTCFDDKRSFVEKVLQMLPNVGTAVVAERAGHVVGAAYAICGYELIDGGKKPPVVGYIYAVGVDGQSRGLGIGGALVCAAAEKARERGAGIIATLPSEKSLYDWYGSVLGLRCILRRREYWVDAYQAEPVMEMTSTEYMLWRENMLKGKTHIHPSNYALELQRQVCREYGGGLYASASGLAAGYVENGECVLSELIAADDSGCADIAASVGAHLGVKRVRYRLPDADGDAYVASLTGELPTDCIWNLTLD